LREGIRRRRRRRSVSGGREGSREGQIESSSESVSRSSSRATDLEAFLALLSIALCISSSCWSTYSSETTVSLTCSSSPPRPERSVSSLQPSAQRLPTHESRQPKELLEPGFFLDVRAEEHGRARSENGRIYDPATVRSDLAREP